MTKTYTLKGAGVARQEKEAHRAEVAAALSLGKWTGGPITSAIELAEALRAKSEAEQILKQFTDEAKKFVDEHGPVIAEDGTQWGPSEAQRETKCNLSLAQMINRLADLGIKGTAAQKLIDSLRRDGVGEVKIAKRYGWSK